MIAEPLAKKPMMPILFHQGSFDFFDSISREDDMEFTKGLDQERVLSPDMQSKSPSSPKTTDGSQTSNDRKVSHKMIQILS